MVLVELSYRLSTLGFLCLDLPSAPGNVGLLDQLLGLAWVRDHITAFGGDPARVTVMGQSAGSASVSLLLLSPLATGLFHRAVLMSGAWPAPWTHNPDPSESASLVARAAGCPAWPAASLLHCLRYTRTAEEIIAATERVRRSAQARGRLGTSLTAPCSQRPGPHQVVPQDLTNTESIAFLNRVPVLIGTVRNEGILFAGLAWTNFYQPTGKLSDRHYFQQQFLTDLLGSVRGGNSSGAAEVKREYFRADELGRPAAVLPGLSAVIGRYMMHEPSFQFALLLAPHSPVYLYSFYHQGENSLVEFLLPPGHTVPLPPGVTHGDDVLYLFDLGVIQLRGADVR
jgi:carboxylesterase type B